MKIKIQFPAILDIDVVKSGDTIEFSDSITVNELLDFLKIKEEHKDFVLVFVNNEEKKLYEKLKDGDEVILHVPVGGG